MAQPQTDTTAGHPSARLAIWAAVIAAVYLLVRTVEEFALAAGPAPVHAVLYPLGTLAAIGIADRLWTRAACARTGPDRAP